MASAPSYVAVKRKREDAPIQSLILEERKTKHARINVEYRLEAISQASNDQAAAISKAAQDEQKINARPIKTPVRHHGPRQFELATNKRSAASAGLLPTFIERPAKRAHLGDGADEPSSQRGTPLKRPGAKTAKADSTKFLGKGPEPSAALSDRLHAFALEEAEHDEQEERTKPRVIVQPKRAIRRKKDSSGSTNGGGGGGDTAMLSEDEDYVYDIYIRSTPRSTAPAPPPPPPPLASTGPTNSTDPSAPRSAQLSPLAADSTAPRSLLESYTSLPAYEPLNDANVGYLILPADAQSSEYFWTASPQGSPGKGGRAGPGSGSEGERDDEDSNAEDFYGADYPEDEVDEDDEMGVDVWRFRRGSEGEDDFEDPGWAGRRESEDSEDSDEERRMMNPWRKFGGK